MILCYGNKEKEEDWCIFFASLYSTKDTGGLICSIFTVRRTPKHLKLESSGTTLEILMCFLIFAVEHDYYCGENHPSE